MAGYNDPDEDELARLRARVAELEAECFSLAAGQCATPAMGEYGHLECTALKKALADAEKYRAWWKEAVDVAGDYFDGREDALARAAMAEERNAHLREMVAELERVQGENFVALARIAELEAELKSPGALRRRLAHHALDLLRESGELGGTRHAPP